MSWVNDRYKLTGPPIGGGGFGDVYPAQIVADGTPIAIKALRDFNQPDCRQRFMREVMLLREYQQPGIVPVLDANLESSPPYYVMPMYHASLKDRIGKLSHEEFLTLFESILSVLEFLDKRGAFHRDLKPENILIDATGRAVLCDFGLGNDPALTANFTQNGAGTPGYVAPELTRHRNGASPKCDIYSLGATAFHLLTGVHPGDAQSLDIAHYLADFPAEIRSKILDMVNPEPTCRPAAKELRVWVQSLHRRIADPVRKRIVAPVRKKYKKASAALRPFRGLPAWTLPLIFVFLLLTVFGGALLFATRSQRSPARA